MRTRSGATTTPDPAAVASPPPAGATEMVTMLRPTLVTRVAAGSGSATTLGVARWSRLLFVLGSVNVPTTLTTPSAPAMPMSSAIAATTHTRGAAGCGRKRVTPAPSGFDPSSDGWNQTRSSGWGGGPLASSSSSGMPQL